MRTMAYRPISRRQPEALHRLEGANVMSTLPIADPKIRNEPRRRSRAAPAEVVLAVEGIFDLAAASRAAAAARALPPAVRVRLDLRRARIHDAALGVFVREAGRRRIVVVVGLSRHHERLLRYLEEDRGAPSEGTEG
jgi:hypothetical protein